MSDLYYSRIKIFDKSLVLQPVLAKIGEEAGVVRGSIEWGEVDLERERESEKGREREREYQCKKINYHINITKNSNSIY